MDDSDAIHTEMGLAEMAEEMQRFTAKPRLFTSIDFPDMKTVVVIYDKFGGIMEYHPQSEEMIYVAFFRSPTGILSDGTIHIVDMRTLDNSEVWVETNKAFVGLLEDKDFDYVRNIEGKWSTDVVLTSIVDAWRLASEMQEAIIH